MVALLVTSNRSLVRCLNEGLWFYDIKHVSEHFALTLLLRSMLPVQSDPVAHLVHFVPFWVDGLVDNFALEELGPHLDDAVGVGLAFDQPSQELVFAQQVLGLDEVDPQDALRRQMRR